MSSLHDDVFAISPDVRSVAVANGQQVDARSRPGLPRAGLPRAGLPRAGLPRAGLPRADLARADLARAGLARQIPTVLAGTRRPEGEMRHFLKYQPAGILSLFSVWRSREMS
jgi:hypothetical protein